MIPQPDSLRVQNEQLQRELGQARAELEDFTYSVAHDLRASLRHVSAYVQIVREDLGEQASPAIAGHLDRVHQAARHMGLQIDALSELSRLTRVEMQLANVDPGVLLQEVCASLTSSLAGRAVVWQLAPDFPPLRCDATLLRQLWTHLLSNALKFSAGRAVAEIKVGWQVQGDGLCALTVSDNGVGFNPAHGHKLFHVFQRLHGAREFEGIGVGLALTRKIAQRHGGSAWANGAPDAGCSVSVTFPLA